jgi:glucuronate isomerase
MSAWESTMKQFLSDEFLLQTKSAQKLYHKFAACMPIFDYHCHLPVLEIRIYKSAMLFVCAVMDHDSGWTQQFHFGALRNTNPRAFRLLGSDTGYDSIGEFAMASALGRIPVKMQFGSGWWVNDQKDGMERQINALSKMGLLSHFVGMFTDSRSFLSYPRHEYFRRVLCNLFGNDNENSDLPPDLELIGTTIQDICYRNAVGYFGIERQGD